MLSACELCKKGGGRNEKKYSWKHTSRWLVDDGGGCGCGGGGVLVFVLVVVVISGELVVVRVISLLRVRLLVLIFKLPLHKTIGLLFLFVSTIMTCSLDKCCHPRFSMAPYRFRHFGIITFFVSRKFSK